MALPPQLSKEERARALQLAKESRQERAAVKRRLQSGDLTLRDFLSASDSSEVLAKMRVLHLIESMPGYGKIRAQNIMDRYQISLTRRVKGLGKHQREALLKEFEISTPPHQGKLIVLSGPGGVGKSTVTKALRNVDNFWISVSATTRLPRVNEVDGVDYFFYSNERFDEAVANDQFLEWAEFAGNRYGTPAAAVNEALLRGDNVLLEIEIEGAKQVKNHMPQAHLVFLEPPSWRSSSRALRGEARIHPNGEPLAWPWLRKSSPQPLSSIRSSSMTRSRR